MITISINGKTYTVAREKMTVGYRLKQFIDMGYLEEVKENKEPDWAIWKLGDTFIFPVEDKIELTEETKKLMCDFAYWYHNWLLNRERRSPEEELDKFLISK